MKDLNPFWDISFFQKCGTLRKFVGTKNLLTSAKMSTIEKEKKGRSQRLSQK